ncbi:hypothetical protein NEIG_02098 [Nematocida sp. ERTm5]|nr:hypothetical protein NEIG_02098 [Nematocida sp. ERTm5]
MINPQSKTDKMNTQKEKTEETKPKEESYKENLPSTSKQDTGENVNIQSMINLLNSMMEINKNKKSDIIPSIISNLTIENGYINSELNRILLITLLKHCESRPGSLSFADIPLEIFDKIRILTNEREQILYNEYMGLQLMKLLHKYANKENISQPDLNTNEIHTDSRVEHDIPVSNGLSRNEEHVGSRVEHDIPVTIGPSRNEVHTDSREEHDIPVTDRPSRADEHVGSYEEQYISIINGSSRDEIHDIPVTDRPSRDEVHTDSYEEHNVLLSNEYETNSLFFKSDIDRELEGPYKLELPMPLSRIDSEEEYQGQLNNYDNSVSILTKDEICEEIERLTMLLNRNDYSLYGDEIEFFKMQTCISRLRVSDILVSSQDSSEIIDLVISNALDYIEIEMVSNYKNKERTQSTFSSEAINTLNHLKKLRRLYNDQDNSQGIDEVDTKVNEDSLASTSNEREEHTLLPEDILNADLSEAAAASNGSILEQILPTNIMEMIPMSLNALQDENVSWWTIINNLFLPVLVIIMVCSFLNLFFNIISSLFSAGAFTIR